MLNNKIKTKIPVYLNHTDNRHTELQRRTGAKQAPLQNFPGTSHPRSGVKERPLGSLMNATKSSSAKIAHKIVKDLPSRCPKESKLQNKLTTSRTVVAHEDTGPPPELPLMERSGLCNAHCA
ncbi:hypothetical protein K1T71_000245 [Dendrolimus kikuchii]|uniref:Uncharacterized protein n=1 Tax=Dendrolimus kikuchii TaxID=765133 RepID=A0ACC1DJN0_9NEOP|nr:hypothetical protein K1T71_000245 [Dendrolimus kikuchii]